MAGSFTVVFSVFYITFTFLLHKVLWFWIAFIDPRLFVSNRKCFENKLKLLK